MNHKAKLYPGVCTGLKFNGDVVYSAKFLKWAEDMLAGGYTVGTVDHQAFCLIFDNPEDLMSYQLVWDQPDQPSHFITNYKSTTTIDTSGYYCPYIPIRSVK